MTLDELNDQMRVLAAIQQRQTEAKKLQVAELDAMRIVARKARGSDKHRLIRSYR
jgi:hypothetical protein